ncbi:MAG: hypothetical protein ACYTEQ_00905 [Planctomycetota bacterium]|jgi:selenophosphate synthetase-related protein
MPNRDLNPHAEARVAMILWGNVYAAGGKGSMGFWDTLNPAQKDQCAKIADGIREARRWTGRRRTIPA